MPPLGDERRPHFFKWLHFAMAEMDASLWTIAKHKFAYPKEFRVEGADKGAKRDFVKAAEIVMDEMASKPFLLGDEFSAVDLFITTMVTWAKRIKWMPCRTRWWNGHLRMENGPLFSGLSLKLLKSEFREGKTN